jgi:cytochrome c-type protein NapB
MKKRFLAIIPTTVLVTGLMFFAGCVSQGTSTAQGDGAPVASAKNDGGLATLRGTPVAAVDTKVAELSLKSVIETNSPMDRNFDDQPPLVSHEVDKYPVTLKANGCMDCHSPETYKKEKANVVPKSHFMTAEGKTLKNLSSRRYFCVQCHVAQIDAQPLVSNTFQPAN